MTNAASSNIQIETDRLILCPPTMADRPAFMALLQSERSRFIRNAAEPIPYNVYFQNILAHWARLGFGHFILQAKTSGHSVGYVAAIDIPRFPEREIGYGVWHGQEGHGFATEGARALIAFAFAELGWETAVSYIHPENLGSIRVAERLGAWLDETAQAPPECALVYRHPDPRISVGLSSTVPAG